VGRGGGNALNVLDLVVCPRDRAHLEQRGDELVCVNGHAYPFVGGIPVLLDETLPPTHPVTGKSLADASAGRVDDRDLGAGEIDPFAQEAVGATCGFLYSHLIDRLPRYPIPELRLPRGDGRLFLEIGSSWGRWCFAAAARGYVPIGIDPSLEAIAAARRIARQLGIEAHFAVADARQLPFSDDVVDVAFSYSVFQHFAKENVRLSLREIARVLKAGGTSLVQMGNARGLRASYKRWRGESGPAADFVVRYWTPSELRDAFATEIGPSQVEVDGFFSLNAQTSDLDLLPRRLRAVVRASDAARAAARVVRPLAEVADSVYVRSTGR
jgi:SAM-dependent methyltransferase/uncharacterized protein YbaR (Trm112 family)